MIKNNLKNIKKTLNKQISLIYIVSNTNKNRGGKIMEKYTQESNKQFFEEGIWWDEWNRRAVVTYSKRYDKGSGYNHKIFSSRFSRMDRRLSDKAMNQTNNTSNNRRGKIMRWDIARVKEAVQLNTQCAIRLIKGMNMEYNETRRKYFKNS